MSMFAKPATGIAALVFWHTSTSWAQDFDLGRFEYQMACAACHASDGKGMGPVGALFQASPPDLTVLAKRNGGVFPLSYVYEVIDGRRMIAAHGTRDMPIWGERFTPDLNRSVAPNAAALFINPSYAPEPAVRARILAVTDYLNRIQEK